MVVLLDLGMENNEKQHWLLLVFYDFEKLASYHLLMNWNFLLFAGKCTLVQNKNASFRNYFHVSKAKKPVYFEPKHISGIKFEFQISGFPPLLDFTCNISRSYFEGLPFFLQIAITSALFKLHRCATTHWKANSLYFS